ncbi:nucleolar protein dao-5 [Diprion similis]|uniref:nucleolar protein dao-5 n=1 Tax=Diprion similis TaxID=362088 RepID=UPI001EF7F940|nr:nucleolar protein dao-5 [Diprion similis]XP_046746543.1 nucleolar protein dao-5 [Diprion similis]
MRRTEGDAMRTAPPFRVLGDGGEVFRVASPPPALAPEPYKVAASSMSTNRARRRSSFVIIAEARPATPTSRSPSPGLASGRASPFRGRGFKGPLPHAQSRPQTPEAKDTRRPSRPDRRMSASQQNSPKRSLIPQPARRRSVSLTKTENVRGSPKYGRRAGTSTTAKNYLEVTPTTAGRRGSLRVPGLSPIQGTPTKPPERRSQQNIGGKKSSPVKSRRNSVAPPAKSGVKVTPTTRSKPPSKPTKSKPQPDTSPSKIPLKKNSILVAKSPQKAPQMSQSSRRGSLAKLGVPKPVEKGDKTSREKPVEPKPEVEKPAKMNEKKATSAAENAAGNTGENVVDSVKQSDSKDEEPSLIELLKQSSGASGTSSVVNTTTVTAVQPLQIDAAALLDGEAVKALEKEPEVKRRNPDSGRKAPAARPTAISVPPSTVLPKINGAQKTPTGMTKPDAGTDSPPREGKNETPKNLHQIIDKPNGHSVDGNKTHNGGGKNANVEHREVILTPDMNRGRHPMGSAQNRVNADVKGTKENVDSTVDSSAGEDLHAGSKTGSVKGSDGSVISSARTVKSDGIRGAMDVSGSVGSNGSSVVVNNQGSAIRRSEDIHGMMGSAVSLKSTAGLSTGSTDTGVSVNTIRGVSSAREKRGMHMVKQPQGIETLSGNVVHLEQNGEPMLPGARTSDPKRKDQDQDLHGAPDEPVSRFKRIFDRCCGCCKCKCNCSGLRRSMRCLACRRGFKPQVNQPSMFQGTNSSPPTGCLSKMKASSRCCRLPEWKGCSRGSRVAPAEDAGCCPPERRCGAVFRRLCNRCSCKRQDATQQTRSLQAKQSLTSVTAPVLPEEPKSKIPEVLVEHNAIMRGAIPCLPIPLAWFCLVCNVLIPGTGTFWSGLFNLCVGQPRFSTVASPRARFGAFLVNTVVGVGQLFTVLFCLVGWGWSIWWGVMMVRLARKYKRFRDSEAANNDVEAQGGTDVSTLPPGVPSQALRGIERAR